MLTAAAKLPFQLNLTGPHFPLAAVLLFLLAACLAFVSWWFWARRHDGYREHSFYEHVGACVATSLLAAIALNASFSALPHLARVLLVLGLLLGLASLARSRWP
jgi:hypothetical protein